MAPARARDSLRQPVASKEDWHLLNASLDSAATWIPDSMQLDPTLPHARLSASMSLRRIRDGPDARAPWLYVERTVSTLLAGVLTRLTALLMGGSIDGIIGLRNAVLGPLLAAHPPAGVAAALGGGVALVVAAAALVQYVAPRAGGGGVTLLMALLNGLSIPGLFTLRVWVVKIFGCIAARVSSMCLGVEAPMVFLGSCVAGLVWEAILKLRRWWPGLPWGAGVRAGGGYKPMAGSSSEEEELIQASLDAAELQELVSAGAAAGIAAAFFSPVGGVLFSWEEASSAWNRRVAWRALVCATVAVLTHWIIQPHIAWHGIAYAHLQPSEWLKQMPFIVLVSAGAGLMGAVFNLLRVALRPLRAPPKRHGRRLAEAGGVAAATLALAFVAATATGSCLPLPAEWEPEGAVALLCKEPGTYNDLATLLFGRGLDVVAKVMALGSEQAPLPPETCSWNRPCFFTPLSLGVLAACYLVLMPLAATALAVPGGLFMPSILAGGAFGALCSQALSAVLPAGYAQLVPGMYALFGATSMLGAVFRSSLSLAVVMYEASGNLQCGGAILISIFVSNLVAKACGTAGMYESEIDHDAKLFYLPQEPTPEMHWKTARDMCAAPVAGLPVVVPAQTVADLLRYTRHNAFPVFGSERDYDTGMGRLDGYMLRGQLQLLLEREVFCDAEGQLLHQPSNLESFEHSLAADLSAAEAAGVPESGASEELPSGPALAALEGPFGGAADAGSFAPAPRYLNLAPFYATPTVVRLGTPGLKIWRMFLALSLRHLWVVDERNYLHGVITRKDLL